MLGHSRSEALALGDRTVLIVDVPMPSFAERQAAWTELTAVEDTRDVAAKFRLSVDQIAAAAEVSRIAARSRDGGGPDQAELDRGARYASVSSVGELAARLDAAYRWDDLVVPERQRMLLRSISAYLRHRDRVLSDWGYERTVARTQGLKVLFAGESGTGKTMGAQVLGAELGLDLYRVDLATVVSKYIGETEKNLERIFTAADGSNAILFFDEADALFGKRSEVSDSHDRYANIEVAYLLQRMEAYPGAVILATNYKRNIDDAFIRRLDFVVDFPFPEADDRRRIWSLVIPAAAPVADDVDLDFLATQFKLSGGAIRNCSLAAAFQAADEDSEIQMRHLVRAVAQEYAQAGPVDARSRLRPLPRVRPPSRGERRLAADHGGTHEPAGTDATRRRPEPGLLVLGRVEVRELVGRRVRHHHALLLGIGMLDPAREDPPGRAVPDLALERDRPLARAGRRTGRDLRGGALGRLGRLRIARGMAMVAVSSCNGLGMRGSSIPHAPAELG